MNFIVSRPLFSHALIAFVLTILIMPVFYYLGVAIFGWLTFAIVSTYFYGRESGQNDHDCVQKRGYTDGQAFFGNILPILFTAENWNQFVIPMIMSGTVALTGQYFFPTWVAYAQSLIS